MSSGQGTPGKSCHPHTASFFVQSMIVSLLRPPVSKYNMTTDVSETFDTYTTL